MKVRSLAIAWVGVATIAAASSASAATLAALSDDDSAVVFGSVELSNLQEIGGSAKLGSSLAAVGPAALRGVSGNLGVNLAAGALNAQANEIAVIGTPQAVISSQQNVHAVAQLSGSGSAQIGDHALAGASGNVGVNIAAGAGNAQFNGLVVH